jgi:hypothetical protein
VPMTHRGGPLISILYMSVASDSFGETDIAGLLEHARRRNAAFDVTGLLVYKEGRFMQLLEGPEPAVQDRYAAITHDPRHHDVSSRIREQITSRRFPDWSMAYQPLDDESARNTPGFSPFLTGEPVADPSFDATSSAWLLRWFRDRTLHDV